MCVHTCLRIIPTKLIAGSLPSRRCRDLGQHFVWNVPKQAKSSAASSLQASGHQVAPVVTTTMVNAAALKLLQLPRR